MHKLIIPEGTFTVEDLIAANSAAEPEWVKYWFACEIRQHQIGIVNGEHGMFRAPSKHPA